MAIFSSIKDSIKNIFAGKKEEDNSNPQVIQTTASEIFFSKEISRILDKADFSRLGDNVAIKTHFGERGCTTYIDPGIVKAVYDKVISLGKKATLVETNVLYRGSRTNRTDHLRTAKEHGFDFAPIDILDGEKGEETEEVKIKKGVATNLKLAKGLRNYDSMIVLSHFKGHILIGYGAALKNIGMGLASRSGKLHMHSAISPRINSKCTGCRICMENCDFGAIDLADGKAVIDPRRCKGCAMCIAVCPVEAPQVPWSGSSSEDVQKKTVDYVEGVFDIIPKTKTIFINVLQNITPECDCMGIPQKKAIEDLGFMLSYDPVAIDQASYDFALNASNGSFEKINRINKGFKTEYAEQKGLGSRKYTAFNIDPS